MTTVLTDRLPQTALAALVACGLGCNSVLDIRPGRETCGIHAPLCDDPSGAHWDPTAKKTYLPGDDTVCDEATGLLWSRAPGDPMTAEAADDTCAGASLDGLSGFRVPTRIELASILDYTRGRPAIDVVAFTAAPEPVWSASRSVGFDHTRLYVDIATGRVERRDLAEVPAPRYRARCVRRDGEDAAPACGDPSCTHGRYCPHQGYLTDIETHLDWQSEVPATAQRLSWDSAIKLCEGLSLDGGGGWRLPRVEELQTLVKDTIEPGQTRADEGAIDRGAFTADMPLTYYWTSSDYLADPMSGKAWTVSFVDGALFEFDKASVEETMTGLAARCVRSAR